MSNRGVSSRTAWKRLLVLAVGIVVAWWISSWIREVSKRDDFIAVDLSGMQHIGPDFNISQFFLNGANGFNVGREGGGGSDVCCVLLPKHWRPGLTVDLRWAINDWSSEIPSEIEVGNYTSVRSGGVYRAKVPVEQYENPGRVVVHFFAGGRARVVVGSPGPYELRHAILPVDSNAVDIATVGKQANDLFTKEEYEEMEREEEKRKKKYGGDWK